MQNRLSIGGNAVQPLLLMFPLGLFAVAIILDLATLLGAPAIIGTLAYWNLIAGLAGGVLAAVAGALDAGATGQPAAAKGRFLILLLDMGVLIFFAVLVLIRVRGAARVADPGLLLLELLGLTMAAAGSWFGGRLDPNHSPGMRRPESTSADDSAEFSTTRREAT
ncbi:hypothetical protein Acy02nite_51560 [Actinoplanes cyaneus]|uniref:DUF2231 domain-containing protein n=1 Tax=Actinoplanes cyaneus TaxID=52696 RepID=A0A919IJM8_9ACTN|nr:DUF2231 domain-containing protein [Actinoplanes cyaneus]MCW2141209.1 putative membrane protein [Actinoplanes cyaneus]GID67275.1 hypothetical protein Acy02nite_51560 [Actinoplanes cyaneus]